MPAPTSRATAPDPTPAARPNALPDILSEALPDALSTRLPDTLLHPDPPPQARPHPAQEPPDRGVRIQRLTTGFASPAEDFLAAPLSLDDLVSRHPAATFFMEMSGDAMLPTIHPHDILVIDRALDPTPGAVLVATVEGVFLVRRFQPGIHSLYLVADNPAAGALRLHEDLDQHVWGVVTHLVRSLTLPERPPRAQ